jgi:hypothetical protein
LSDNSPSINAGKSFFVWEGDTLINLSSDEYIGVAPDMGALESDVLISVDEKEELPTEFKLEQNYPNPFNPTTKVEVKMKESGSARLDIYNLLGEKVLAVVDSELSAGVHEINIDGSSLASGIYIYKFDIEGRFSQIKKMNLIK